MKPAAMIFASIFLLSLLSLGMANAVPTYSRVLVPTIITKDQWGSMKEGEFWQDHPFDPYSQGILGDPVAITIHHTYKPVGSNPPDPEQDKKKILEIQHMHVGKGWGDVGYHFLIGSDGAIYEGRPLGYTGTHAPPNYGHIGVNVIGDFQESEYPSNAQLEAVVRLTSWLCDRFDMDPTAQITLFEQSNLAVSGHRDWNPTLCPGDRLYPLVANVREQIRARLLSGVPAYDARIACNQFLPATLLAGREYELPFTIRNVGFAQWHHLNEVALRPATPEMVSVLEPALKAQEIISPLSNRLWNLKIATPGKPGTCHVALQMGESKRTFGPELAWDARVLGPDSFISQWLVSGPYPADSPEKAYARDYFAGKPLDEIDIMDQTSEAAHGYKVTGEYDNGEENRRGEDGERTKDGGRYFRGGETFNLSLAGYRDGNLVLRRRINAGIRDQQAEVYMCGDRLATWETHGSERFRTWQDIDLVIPAYRMAGRKMLDVELKVTGTKQWGCTSFRYSLLDKAEPITAPRPGDKDWRSWKSDAGVTDLSQAFSGADKGGVYLAAYVKSPKTTWAQLRTGCPGRLKAWLNGEKVIASTGGPGSFPDTGKGDVLVRKGWNRLLVKVALDTGVKDLYVRLCDRAGKPLEGISYTLEPSEKTQKRWVAMGPREEHP